MIEKNTWMNEFIGKLQAHFGRRLLFTGLQGSYRRGEATETSDFDVVTVLDKLDMDDLDQYRRLAATMPEHEKACGFICGKEELQNWPKFEIFQLSKETENRYGRLEELLPQVSQKDMADAARIAASAVYHVTCHSWLYGDENKAENLRETYKGVFFTQQLLYCLSTGRYIETRKELKTLLTGRDREILEISSDWNAFAGERRENPRKFFDLLLHWSAEVLRRLSEA